MKTFTRLLRLWRMYAWLDFMWITRSAQQSFLYFTGDTIVNLAALTSTLLLAERFDGIGPWSKFQIIFMLGYAATATGLLDIFCGYNVLFIGRRLGRGQFDHTLIQPQPLWMALLTDGFNPFGASSAFLTGLALTVWAGGHLALSPTLGWLALFGLNLIASSGIVLAVSFFWGSFAFFAPRAAEEINTPVKLLSSMLAPDTGSVRVLGYDPVRQREKYVNHIGVVFGQRTELWWDHPVSASFEWKRVVWDIPDERYRRMVGVVKELLGLDEFFNSLARELSLGQRMRADLGLALIHEPEILFLDEPTLGLDVLAKRRILQFVKDLNHAQKVTVMLTSHDMSDLEQLAERIVMIDKGRLAFDGDFSQLRREFADRRRLFLETPNGVAPLLDGAKLVQSAENRHEYVFDASRVNISTLLEQAAAQTQVLDVETHRAPIDDVIADIYEKWQSP
jgi:ABC-2 type transport system ATP-binding protein